MTISTDALEGIEDIGEAGAGYAGEHRAGLGHHHAAGRQVAHPALLDRHRAEGDAAAARRLRGRYRGLAGRQGRRQARPLRELEFVTGAANKIRGFMLGYTQPRTPAPA
jgi:hypothetical protein